MSVISPRLTRRESDEIQWLLGVTGTADVCRLVAGLAAALCLVSGLSHSSIGRPGEDFEKIGPALSGFLLGNVVLGIPAPLGVCSGADVNLSQFAKSLVLVSQGWRKAWDGAHNADGACEILSAARSSPPSASLRMPFASRLSGI